MQPLEDTASRHTFNLLVTGHRKDRNEPATGALQRTLTEVLPAVLELLRQDTVARKQRLRLFTGLSPGTDRAALRWASHWKEVECYGVTAIDEAPADLPPGSVRILAIGHPESVKSLPSRWVEAADDYKLLKADCVVAVWDGAPAFGDGGGSVRLIAEALRREIPVVWVPVSLECAPSVYLSKIGVGPAAALVDPLRPETLREPLFGRQPMAVAGLPAALAARRDREERAVADDRLMKRLAEHDPGDGWRMAGFWHSQFFAFSVLLSPAFGKQEGRRSRNPWKRRSGVYTAWRGTEKRESGEGGLSEKNLKSGLSEEAFWFAFDRMDRTASYAASLYRDRIVLIHLLSSFAVLGAVAGAINWLGFGDVFWGLWELLALGTIGVILWRDRRTGVTSRDAWLLSRQTAELMRLSGILYPYLASLAPLHRRPFLVGTPDNEAGFGAEKQATETADRSRVQDTGGSVSPLFVRSATRWWVAQRLREAEVPSLSSGKTYCLSDVEGDLRTTLVGFLTGQKDYHQSTAHKYEVTHRRLHRATQSVYFLALGVVLLHLICFAIIAVGPATVGAALTDAAHWVTRQDWLLLITAFFPALAAALHGILTNLEFLRLAQNSKRMAQQLGGILENLEQLDPGHPDPIALRALAVWAVETLFREHDHWAELMSDQNIGIPV